MPDVERYPKLHELREKLYHAAKADQNRRFYTLKDKVYREDVLRCSWESVKSNKGSPGIDAQTINHVIEYGEDRFLNELAEDIRTETYRVKDIKRVYIPKKNGNRRPLGIPEIRFHPASSTSSTFFADMFPRSHIMVPGELSSLGPGRAARRFLTVVDPDLEPPNTAWYSGW